MTRWYYDGLFFRLSCIIFVAIAFTFTVIITNVFVDIDGLLAGKNKDLSHVKLDNDLRNEIAFETGMIEDSNKDLQDEEESQEDEYNYLNYPDSNRSKRSIVNQNFLLRLQNPKLKSILTKRLATLLEEMDNDEKATENVNKNEPETSTIYINEDNNTSVDLSPKYVKEDTDLLHLAMHNILLQGIIKNMDVNQIYRKVNGIVGAIKDVGTNGKGVKKKNTRILEEEAKNLDKIAAVLPHFESVTKGALKGLEEKQVTKAIVHEVHRKQVNQVPNFIIRTSIDIVTDSEKSINKTFPDVKSDLKVTFNGKSIAMNNINNQSILNGTQPSDNHKNDRKSSKIVSSDPSTSKNDVRISKKVSGYTVNEILNERQPNTDNNYINSLVSKYINDYEIRSSNGDNEYIKKRMKRDIKKKKRKKGTNNVDDELLIEIETHFDPNSLKNENKKKVIKKIISKIQKAIEPETIIIKNTSKVRPKNFHIKKRNQNSILEITKANLVRRDLEPDNVVIKRQLYAINKLVEPRADAPLVYGNRGEGWKIVYRGPGFLTTAKSINSAEAATVDVDYKKVLKSNGIPHRHQFPINTDASTEYEKRQFDFDDIQLLLADKLTSNNHAPESDKDLTDYAKYKIYYSLKDVSKEKTENITDNSSKSYSKILNKHLLTKREFGKEKTKNRHSYKRSINFDKEEYHSNAYRIDINHNFLPFKNYQDVLEYNGDTDKQNNNQRIKSFSENKINELPFLQDNDILTKKLNPSDIFELAEYLNRRKRSTSFKSKKRHSITTFVNTNPKFSGKIYINSKTRPKRDLNKIRIIASDDFSDIKRNSNENVYIVADETVEDKPNIEQYKGYPYEDPYEFLTVKTPLLNKLLSDQRNSQLMSKYPHLFLEPSLKKNDDKDKRSEEEIEAPIARKDDSTTESLILSDYSAPNSDYKFTVNILPENTSEETEFKELRTMFHKRFNKNGVQFYQSVNVSEISNIENDTDHSKHLDVFRSTNSPLLKQIKLQQEKIKQLIKSHKDKIDQTLASLRNEKQDIIRDINLSLNNNSKETNALKSKTVTEKPKIVVRQNLDKEEVSRIVTDILKQRTLPDNLEPTTVKPFSKDDNASPINIVKIDPIFAKAILDRLDKNTYILSKFLNKLTDQEKVPKQIIVLHQGEKENEIKYSGNLDPTIHTILAQTSPYTTGNKGQNVTNFTNSVNKNSIPNRNMQNEAKIIKTNNEGRFFLSPIDYDVLPKANPSVFYNNSNKTESSNIPNQKN